jgi:hypothetical protein
MPKVGSEPMPKQASPPVPKLGSPLKDQRFKENLKEQSSLLEIADIRVAVERWLDIPPDDDGLRRLLHGCRQFAPTCTVEEVALAVALKARNTRHSLGWFITVVPKLFENGGYDSLQRIVREQGREGTAQAPEPPTEDQAIETTRRLLQQNPNHVQAPEWRQQIAEFEARQAGGEQETG